MANKSITVRILGDASNLVGALRDSESEVGSWAGRLGPLAAAGAAAAGAAVGAALVKGTLDALDSQAITDRLGSSLGLSDAEAERLGGIAGDLYANAYGDSFSGVADVLRTAVQVGIPEGELEALTGQAFSLEGAFGGAAGEYLTLAGQLQSQGLTSSVTEGLDFITTSFQQLPAEMQGPLTEAVAEYGTFLDGLGFSTEESFGFLTAAAADGEFALDKAGDAVKEFGIRSTDMSTASVAAYEAIGLDAKSMSDQILAGGDTAGAAFDTIIDGLLGIKDPTEQANAAIALFGTPLEDLGVDKIPDFLGSLGDLGAGFEDVAGASAELDAQLNDNLGTKIESLKRQAFQGLADVAEKFVIPALETMIPLVVQLGQFVADNIEYFAAAALGITIALVPAFIAWAASAGAAAIATLTAAAPVIAIGVAVAALAAGLVWAYQNVDFFHAAVDAVASFMKDTLWPIIKTIVGAYISFYGAVINAVRGLIGDLIPAVGAVIGWFGDLIAKAIEVAGQIKDGFDEVVDFVTGLPDRIATAASGMFDGIKEAFRSALNWIIGKWNDLSFSLPSVDTPFGSFGGFTLDTPDIRKFHDGGIVPGRYGEEVFAILQAGETVRTREQEAALGRGITIENFYAADRPLFEEMAELEARYGVLV